MFGSKPQLLMSKGEELFEKSEEFASNAKKILDTINEMVTSNYCSPEALAIANVIRNYQDDLESMRRAIVRYSEFCKISSTKTVRNQENIISNIKPIN